MVKKKLSIEALIPGGELYAAYQPDMPDQVKVYDHCFSLLFPNRWESYDLNGSLQWSFSLKELNFLLKPFNKKELKQIPVINFLDSETSTVWYKSGNNILFIDGEKKKITIKLTLPPKADNVCYNEKSHCFAYTKGNSIRLISIDGKESTLISEKKTSIRIDKVPSRDEFGIHQVLYWSNDGSKLAFYRTDESRVNLYPMVKIDDPVATLAPIRYPMAGQSSERVSIGIIHINEGTVSYINPQHEESYLTSLTWSLNDRFIYLSELERNQKYYATKRFDVFSGKLDKILYEEKDDKYVEPQYPFLFIDDESFLFQSRRDGYNHVYLYKKGETTQITSGQFEITELIGLVNGKKEIACVSTEKSPLDRNPYIFNIETGEHRLIHSKQGKHRFFVSMSGLNYVDCFCSRNNPGEIYFGRIDSKSSDILFKAVDPYEKSLMPVVEVGNFQKEGDTLYYRIVRPADMKQGKKYPLVFYVYGGPHVQLIKNEWGSGSKGFEEMMANEGFVVFSIDPHGSDARGKKFESAIWRNIGNPQLSDYSFALQWLFANKDYVDSSSVAVYGWSFGGFMTLSLMLKYPELFKIGVAGGAVVDWRYYEVMYTERYMETPQLNPKGYEENDMKNYVSSLKGNLYLIHCDNDPVVLWQNTLSFLRTANEKGKQMDYYVYPGYPHNVQGPLRVHLMEKVKTTIKKYIKC